MEDIPSVDEVVDATIGQVEQPSGVSAKRIITVIGLIALGVFMIGNITFNMANYRALQNLKKKEDLLKDKNDKQAI